jgi:hypothetical protein
MSTLKKENDMLNLDNNTKIDVVCPAYTKTGGPELLHQLVGALKAIHLTAKIAYIGVQKNSRQLTEDSYVKYIGDSFEVFSEKLDKTDHLIILPETAVSLIHTIKHARVIVWWLSVDNYTNVFEPKYYLKNGFKSVISNTLKCNWRSSVKNIRREIFVNLAQSYYAMDFLRKNNFENPIYLSDYINDEYIQSTIDFDNRKNLVFYNPKKGLKFTHILQELDPSIQWVPIKNMNASEIRELLRTGKVYIDFGNHPGKDRLPREAAISGCCIITGHKGSANFYDDIPIPDNYKLEDSPENCEIIVKEIRKCLDNYNVLSKDFEEYRNSIREEKVEFYTSVSSFFL